jgi:hypothetical protein
VVVLGGSAAAPRVLLRERLEMTDDALAGAKQPYHTIEALPPGEARRQLTLFETSAGSLARIALQALAERVRAQGGKLRAAGILDSAGRSGDALAAILASHALIHTADGNHFRAALAEACAGLELPVTRVPQRALLADASQGLGRPPGELTAAVAALGRGLGSPWGVDQKGAALLAWLLLARVRGST